MALADWISKQVQQRIAKVAKISQFMVGECDTPWDAILEVLPAAAIEPLLGFITPSEGEIERNALRPRGLKGPRKFTSKKRWYNTATIPDIGEELGKTIGNAADFKLRPAAPGEAIVWAGIDAFEHALYELMIFDLALDTWYNAVIALQRRGFCRNPNYKNGDGKLSLLYEGGPDGSGFWRIASAGNPWVGEMDEAKKFTCSIWAQFTNTSSKTLPIGFNWTWLDQHLQPHVKVRTSEVRPQSTASLGMVFSCRARQIEQAQGAGFGPETFVGQAYGNGTAVIIPMTTKAPPKAPVKHELAR